MNLPSGKDLKHFLFWLTGRSVLGFTLFLVRSMRLAISICVSILSSLERYLEKIMVLYDNLIAPAATTNSFPLIDIASYIEGRQIMVIGEMGAGKSTLVKYLCYLIGGKIKVYECEGLPQDWGGFEVIGRGGDFQAIAQEMQKDIQALDAAIANRNRYGDGVLESQVYIVEEFPEIVRRCEISIDWIDLHSRRGKKAKKSAILISQYDKVAAWGLDRKSELADSFIKIRLGKKALSYARKLNNTELEAWLCIDSSHCMIDDYPCKIPAFREMQAISGIISNQLSSLVSANQNNGKYWELK